MSATPLLVRACRLAPVAAACLTRGLWIEAKEIRGGVPPLHLDEPAPARAERGAAEVGVDTDWSEVRGASRPSGASSPAGDRRTLEMGP